MIGFVLAAVAAMAMSRFDRRLRSLADIETVFQMQILSVLPKVRRPILQQDGSPRPAKFLLEPVRRLNATLRSLQLGDGAAGNGGPHPPGSQSILLLSADVADGKSTLSASLALVQRDAGDRVTVIDADFRRPALARLLGLPGAQGLADVLTGTLAVGDAMQRWKTGHAGRQRSDRRSPAAVATMPESTARARCSCWPGGPVANPPALLASAAITNLLRSVAGGVRLGADRRPAAARGERCSAAARRGGWDRDRRADRAHALSDRLSACAARCAAPLRAGARCRCHRRVAQGLHEVWLSTRGRRGGAGRANWRADEHSSPAPVRSDRRGASGRPGPARPRPPAGRPYWADPPRDRAGCHGAGPESGLLLFFVFVAGGMIVVALTFFSAWSGASDFWVLPLLPRRTRQAPYRGGRSDGGRAQRADFAICLGVGMRMLAKRQALRLPPMSGWIVAYVVIVLADAFNPNTISILKSLGGIRDLLQWVPFFFFGYVLIRSEASFRRLFIVIGVLALANGVTATIQTRMSLSTVAAWGPGYKERVFGNEATGKGSRKYNVEGVGRVRPMALGSDSGFGGGVGVSRSAVLPGVVRALARASTMGARAVLSGGPACLRDRSGSHPGRCGRDRVSLLRCAGGLSGRKVTSALKAILIVVALAIPAGVLLVSVVEEKGSSRATTRSAGVDHGREGQRAYVQIPGALGRSVWLRAGGLGRWVELRRTDDGDVEVHGFSSETQYNFGGRTGAARAAAVARSFGHAGRAHTAAGCGAWLASTIRIAFTGVSPPFSPTSLWDSGGPLMESAASGPFFFFTMGMVAYWLVGPGRAVGEHAASPKTSAVEARAAGAV